jgi:TonB family protein
VIRPAALVLLLALGPAAAAAQQPRVAEVQIAPHYLRIVVDAEAPLLATGYDVNGVPVDAEFRWASSNINVAEVDEDGNVHAVAPGSTVITATTGSGSARRYGQVSVYVFRPRGAMVMVPPLPPDKSPGMHPTMPPGMPPGMPNMDSIVRASIDCSEPFIAAANPMRACYDRRPMMMREHERVPLTPTEGQCPTHRGVVAMLLLVSETGAVTEVRQYAPSGCNALDSLATQRARATQFEPAQKDGHPVSAWVRFMLHVE